MPDDHETMRVSGLTVSLAKRSEVAPVPLVEDVGFTLTAGHVHALVGESGCGKSITTRALIDVLPTGVHAEGEVVIDGQDIGSLPHRQRRRINGSRIALVPQDPMTALNPVLKLGPQMIEGLRYHRDMRRRDALAKIEDLCRRVGIPEERNILNEYPHQLSGGMQQRIVIAMMLACEPRVVLADEPTTALDVRIQQQLLELIHNIAHSTNTAFLLVTHDLGVVAEACDEVTVMYAGRVVEEGPVQRILRWPRHPYTAGLLAAVPRRGDTRPRLETIPGTVPEAGQIRTGCRFRDRCPRRDTVCEEEPSLDAVTDAEKVRCWFPLTPQEALGEHIA